MLAAELAPAGVDAMMVERREGPELESSRSGGLQARTIEAPKGWRCGIGASVRRECEVTGFAQDAGGVDVAGGWAVAAGGVPRDGYARIVVRDEDLTGTREPTLADLSAGMTAVWGTDFGVHDARWISRSRTPRGRRRPTGSGGCCSRATRRTCTRAWADRGSTPGCKDVVNLGWKLDATCDGPWELPVLGAVEAPPAVLVRPDGHVAWVGAGDSGHPGLADALGTGSGRRSR
jgi:hypothetical protein